MNIWIKRSLATVAVAGGLVLAGAAAAQADDPFDASSNSSDSNGSLSAPIEIGGISVGSTSESSSSSTSTTTTTDGQQSTTDTSSTSEQSASDQGITTGPITIDPAAALSSGSSSQEESTGGSDGSNQSSSQSDTSGSASSPVHVGGVQVHSHQDQARADQSESTSTDGDRSTTDGSATQQSSSSDTQLGVGAIDADPGASFGQAQQQSDSSLGDEDGIDQGRSSSQSQGAATSPLSFEGLSGSQATSNSSTDQDWSAATDGDRSSSTSHAQRQDDSTVLGFTGGGFATEPYGAFASGQDQRADSVGDDAGTDRADSSSWSDVTGGSPFVADGFTGAVETAQETWTADERTASDADRSTTDSETSHDQSRDGQAFGFDGFSGDPVGQLMTDLSSSDES
jgi:hypothetical protein